MGKPKVNIELMQQKLGQQKTIPNELRENLNNITFLNLLVAIFVLLLLSFTNMIYMSQTQDFFTKYAKVLACLIAVVDIIFFELSYRKEDGKLALFSIELLCIGLFILSTPYLFCYTTVVFRQIAMFLPVFFSIYYVSKCLIIHIIETMKYQNTLSDVHEILKEEQNESYIEDIDNREDTKIKDAEKEEKKND